MARDTENLRTRSKIKAQGEDADFLVEEFDVSQADAAELVARDGASPDDVSQEARNARRRRDDPLEGAPVPEDTADLVADTDEEQLKPVVRTGNKRNGAG